MDLAVQTRGKWDLVLAAARWAEERGLAAFAMPDHYLVRGDDTQQPAYDHLIQLAALAHGTSRIELVSLVSPVTFRHPAVYLKTGTTIDDVSGGRFTMGIGTGWLDEEFSHFGIPYPDLTTRFEMVEECLAYLQAGLSDKVQGFEGKHYRLESFTPHPQPQNLRLLVGGTGDRKTPALAGRFADEYNIYACLPDEFVAKRELAEKNAAEVGRDPSSILFSSVSPGIAAKKEPEYRRLLEMHADRFRSTPDHIESVYQERGYPHGSGSQPSEMLAALEEVGCRRFYPQLLLENLEDFDLILDAYQP
jgi:alkanesulfonate monooxygenase SsuD/methylene tetrahydromethanopterin reductase-like flavin-dependent oxidoreductase (luciferase family)